jgi:hypothetical protein
MRLWRTWPARARVATLAGIGVIAAGVVELALTRYTPPAPEVVHGPPILYSSPAIEGRNLTKARPKPRVQTDATPSTAYRGSPARPSSRIVSPARLPEVGAQASSQPRSENVPAVSALAARFPIVAHQALAADPAAGTEAQYFARLGNLLNGTPMPAGQPIPADADHLAHAQNDLDHDNLAGAVAEVRQVSGLATSAVANWLSDAEAQLAQHGRTAPKTQVAQNGSRQRVWPDVMPTEIPPYARQSTGPAG